MTAKGTSAPLGLGARLRPRPETWNGQISGMRMIAAAHISRFSGMPTRMKSVKR
jgi:hypothetical protein